MNRLKESNGVVRATVSRGQKRAIMAAARSEKLTVSAWVRRVLMLHIEGRLPR